MIPRLLKWLLSHIWEKINVRNAWREFKALGKKYGTRFFIAAAIWEFAIEDGLFPLICVWKHHPELAVLCLFIHFEPVVYPTLIWGFRMYDRFRGREPWEPERSAMSTYWRTATKVLVYRCIACLAYWSIIGSVVATWTLTVYIFIMFGFAYVHERIWHDSSWGINEDDAVMEKRIIAKTLTYRAVSFAVMAMVVRALTGSMPLGRLCYYQVLMLVVFYLLERVWSKSMLGIMPVVRNHVKRISQDAFVRLVGVPGVECFRRHSTGSSWLLPDGRMAAEVFSGKWEYLLMDCR